MINILLKRERKTEGAKDRKLNIMIDKIPFWIKNSILNEIIKKSNQ